MLDPMIRESNVIARIVLFLRLETASQARPRAVWRLEGVDPSIANMSVSNCRAPTALVLNYFCRSGS